MATQTLGNLNLQVQQVTTAGVGFTLETGLEAVVLQARGGAIQVKLGAVGDTEYWTLTDGQPQSFAIPDLAGRQIFFDAASTLDVEILQVLKST